jgi:multidrug efflux system membrane fusion protein
MGGGLAVQATIGADPEVTTGRLTFIDNAVDQTTGTIKMKGTFTNADHRLWPGQFINVTLTTGQQANAILVPSQAVQVGQKGQYVYVVGQNNTAEMRIVNVGLAAGANIAVTGVRPGEAVVTDGQSRLMPGAAVQVVNKNAQSAAVVGQ